MQASKQRQGPKVVEGFHCSVCRGVNRHNVKNANHLNISANQFEWHTVLLIDNYIN